MAGQTNTSKAIKSVSTQTLLTFLTGVIEIVSFSIMSRLLTQKDFGYYAAVTAVSSIFLSFSDAGVGSAIVQRKSIDQKYLDNAFTLCLLFGLFGSSLLLFCSGPISRYVADESMQVPLMLVAITLLTGTLSSISFSLMHRKLQFLRMGVIRIFALIFTTIVSIALAFNGFGYYAIIAKVILYSIITLFASFLAVHKKYHLAFNLKVYKEILAFGGWLSASSFFRRIAEQIDRLMMSNMFSVTVLGMYSRPKEFINTMTGKLCDIFDTSLFPILSSIQDNNDRIIKSYQSALYYLNIIGLILSFTFVFNSELFIRIFLGPEWMNVNTLFIILSFSGICMINGSLGDIYLRSLAFTKQQFYLRILQSILSIVFIVLASYISVQAIAVAYLLAYSIVVIVKMNFISNKINFRLIKSIKILLNAYKICYIYMIAYVFSCFFIPNTLFGNIIKLMIFISITFFAFILCPQMVGKKYKYEMHQKILSIIKKRI